MEFNRTGNPKGSIGIGNPMLMNHPNILDQLEKIGFEKFDSKKEFYISWGEVRTDEFRRLMRFELDNYVFDFILDPDKETIYTDIYRKAISSNNLPNKIRWEKLPFSTDSPETVLHSFKKYAHENNYLQIPKELLDEV